MKLLGLWVLGIIVMWVAMSCGALLVMGHGSISYQLANETDQPLLTWLMDGDCSEVSPYWTDYTHDAIVQPGAGVEYGAVWDGGGGCVHVATEDRLVVAMFDYESDGKYVVSAPVATSGPVVPPLEELQAGPREPWWLDGRAPVIIVFLSISAMGATVFLTVTAFVVWRLALRAVSVVKPREGSL